LSLVIRFKFKFKMFEIATFAIVAIIFVVIELANLAFEIIQFKKLISNYKENT